MYKYTPTSFITIVSFSYQLCCSSCNCCYSWRRSYIPFDFFLYSFISLGNLLTSFFRSFSWILFKVHAFFPYPPPYRLACFYYLLNKISIYFNSEKVAWEQKIVCPTFLKTWKGLVSRLSSFWNKSLVGMYLQFMFATFNRNGKLNFAILQYSSYFQRNRGLTECISTLISRNTGTSCTLNYD